MDNDELLDRIRVEIRLAVAEAMQIHRQGDHNPVWDRIEKLQRQVDFWRGAVFIVGAGLTTLVTFLEISHR